MQRLTWMTLYPEWYASERARLAKHYPDFRVDGARLGQGALELYGELVVRVAGGARRFPVALWYPEATPYEKPIVVPLETMPVFKDERVDPSSVPPKLMDHRHQMPGGGLCLFQRETRADPDGDVISGVDALRRASRWFVGTLTGHWPPDSAESELEAHFSHFSDILVSNTFYHESLAEGHGRFSHVRDYRRLIDTPNQLPNECPMVMTALTNEGGDIAQVIDARTDLRLVYPWIQSDAWNPTTIVQPATRDADPLSRVAIGYWWALPAEPRPFSHGAGLLNALRSVAPDGDPWEMLWAKLVTTYSIEEYPVIGFRYPGRSGEPEWLMVTLRFGARREGGGILIDTDATKRGQFEQTEVYGVRSHSVRPTVLRLRNTGVVKTEVSNKSVALIGLGALGSGVAEMLAKAGVGHFRLCDSDRLATGNVARHVGGISEFAASKVRVVASRLLEINPYLTFEEGDVLFQSATRSLTTLTAFMKEADLVVSTTADEGVESLINHLAVLENKPVLYARSLRRGSVGRVFMVRPGKDACKACLTLYAKADERTDGDAADWLAVPEGEDDTLLHECGRPVVPASAVDLTFIAALAAREALSFLEQNSSEANHWTWSREALPEIDARLKQPFSTLIQILPPHGDCPVCYTPDVNQLVLMPGVRDTIAEELETVGGVETGGILIGHIDEQRRAVVERATGPGPSSEQTPMIFRRDVAHVQGELDRARNELRHNGLYLGEWHSHLEPDPTPSPTDIASLTGIAENADYLTRSPVMIIAGTDPVTRRATVLKGWSFRVGGGMWPVDVTDPKDSA
jgi:integrative and conjugative element protein (TIGR02256 family)